MRVGDGSCIMITRDSWLPGTDSSIVRTALGEEYANATGHGLMIPGEFCWDVGLLNDTFNQRDMELILCIPLSNRRIVD